MRYAMIMAGGTGTRLWPLSRVGHPKQFAPIIQRLGAPRSLLSLAAERIEPLIPLDRVLVTTHAAYRELVAQALPNLPLENLLVEPEPRDTATAIGLAAAVIDQRTPGATLAVLPADHLIDPEDRFRAAIETAFALIDADPRRLVTLTIKPTEPSTAVGYAERGTDLDPPSSPDAQPDAMPPAAFCIERFVERPTRERAQAYIDSASFEWNTGTYIARAATLLDCLKRYKPKTHTALVRIANDWDTPQRDQTLRDAYADIPPIGVHYAILEPAAREHARSASTGIAKAVQLCGVRMDLQWLDVGSWNSYAHSLEPDDSGNRLFGDVLTQGCTNTLVVNAPASATSPPPDAEAHMIAAIGCEDLIIVRSGNATLVMPADKAEELKNLHAKLPPSLQ